MSKLKQKILNTIAWIAFAIGIVMVLWRIFGNSPTDLAVISPFVVFGLAKIWYNSNTILELKINMKHGFDKVREDINRLESKIGRRK